MERTKFRLHLLQPEAHVHLVVHRRRRHEMLLCLRLLPSAPIELAKAEVAVGGQRAHPELVGPGEGLIVMPFG